MAFTRALSIVKLPWKIFLRNDELPACRVIRLCHNFVFFLNFIFLSSLFCIPLRKLFVRLLLHGELNMEACNFSVCKESE